MLVPADSNVEYLIESQLKLEIHAKGINRHFYMPVSELPKLDQLLVEWQIPYVEERNVNFG